MCRQKESLSKVANKELGRDGGWGGGPGGGGRGDEKETPTQVPSSTKSVTASGKETTFFLTDHLLFLAVPKILSPENQL